MCFVYHRLHYQLAFSKLIVSRKIEEGHRKEAPLLDEPGWAQEKKVPWMAWQRKTPKASFLCLQWPYKAIPDTCTSLWRSRLSPPECSVLLPRSCAWSPEPVRLPLKGEWSRTGCRDKIITAIFQQMKKKAETRARIRCKKENTWTRNRRFYTCAERKTGVAFMQNNL